MSGGRHGEGEPARLAPEQAGAAARTISRAISWHSPMGAWALPDTETREETLLGLAAADIARLFIPWGEAWTIDGVAVALWSPPASAPGAERFEHRRGDAEYRAYGAREDAMRRFDQIVTELRPPGEHWYLDMLATDPELMGRGLGARLLTHCLELRDAEGATSALDTLSERTVELYRRFGFEVSGHARLPYDGPPFWMMIREPRGA